MSKFCTKCGSQLNDNDTFCSGCGERFHDDFNKSYTKVQNRNIVLQVVLSIITCGLYALIWMITITDDANKVSDETSDTPGILAIIFCILTCGIYTIYWHYKMGKKLYNAGIKYNMSISDNSVLYLLLSLFGLAFVNTCIMQNDLNKFSN